MIDEKKLIKAINEIYYYITGFRGGKIIFGEYLERYKNDVIRTIEIQPKVGEWIPCSERLPVPPPNADYGRGEYIGTIITEEQKTFVTSVIFDYIKNDWVEEVTGWEIIAWQELPKPYRKDG